MSRTTSKRVAPYGFWESPITAKDVALNGSMIVPPVQDILVDPVNQKVFYLDERPSEGGRNVLVSLDTGHDVNSLPWNICSSVHEYGGAPCIINDDTVYFSNLPDGRIYSMKFNEAPVPVTPINPSFRYADFALLPFQKRLIVSILEDHTIDTPTEVVNKLVVIDMWTQTITDLAAGADFYSSPRFSPDGAYLAWKQWDHPDMPWEGGQTMVAACATGVDESGIPTVHLGPHITVAGKHSEYGTSEPTWASNQKLLFLSDKDDYFNPWQYEIIQDDLARSEAVPISPAVISEDFGEPAWFLSWSSYAKLYDNYYVYSSFRSGKSQLYLVDIQTREFTELQTPFSFVQYLRNVADGKVLFYAKTPSDNDALVELVFDSLHGPLTYNTVKTIGRIDINAYPPSLISQPQPIELQSKITRQSIHIIYYPPQNPEYEGGLPGELPPVILNIHGGPTAFFNQGLDFAKQYFTSRGFAFIDLNQSGSSTYGRKYRERLNGQWGPLDAKDAAEAVRHLSDRKMVDIRRAAVRGGSAGGYATWTIVTLFPIFFNAATVLCGIADMRALRRACHKFESRNLETLIGAPLDEDPELWDRRSPITQVHRVRAPVLVIHGTDDTVVPISQAETMVNVIKQNGGYVEFVAVEGEGHMMQKAETNQIWLERELALYQRVFARPRPG